MLTAHATTSTTSGNNTSKLSLSMTKPDRSDSRDSHDTPSSKRFGSLSSHGKNNSFNNGPLTSSTVASPTGTGGSSAFSLGSGAFGFSNATKTPKTPGAAFDFSKSTGGADKKEGSDREEKEEQQRRPLARKSQSSLKASAASSEPPPEGALPLKHTWVIHYRPPTPKNEDYEKATTKMLRMSTARDFWRVYFHLKRPSALPAVSDYHFFKEGIRPVWEDEQNKRGGKWTLRLKKGVADRYWEDLLLALIGEQFAEAGEEVCGAVVSVRSTEDQISIWTKVDGGRNVKIRETIKRVLELPADTQLTWKSHDESRVQGQAAESARQEKDKRRNTLPNKATDEPA
jgi:translation initiation factor 4E